MENIIHIGYNLSSKIEFILDIICHVNQRRLAVSSHSSLGYRFAPVGTCFFLGPAIAICPSQSIDYW